MLYAKNDLTIKRIQSIKDATKRKLLDKATNNWKKPVTDFVLREVVWGDTSVTDFYDIQPKTSVCGAAAGNPVWGFDASDLTANSLQAVTSSGKSIDDNKWIGFYGYFDIAPVEGIAAPTITKYPMAGNVTAVEFKRGSSVLDLWKVSSLYAQEEVVGFTDTPVIYEENEAYEILANASVAEDVHAGLRGYTCEALGQGHLNPVTSMDVDARATRGVTSVSQLSQMEQVEAVMRAGMDPVQEMSLEQIGRLYDRAKLGLYSMIVADGGASSVSEARKNYYIRQFNAGDDTAADTYIDVDLTGSGAATEHWVEAVATVVVGDLTNVFTTGETINDRDYVAIFGLSDRTPNSALLSVAPGDSGGNLDFCDVQHMYAYHSEIRGYTQRITYYKQNAAITYKMNVGVDRDHYVMPIGLTAEPYGAVVSRT